MLALVLVLAVVSLGAIAGTLSLVARDGYGRREVRRFVRAF